MNFASAAAPADAVRIADCSDAVKPDLALIALADILAVADRNNARDEITGALLVSRGRFF